MQQPHTWNPFNSLPPVSTAALYGSTSSWAHTVPSLMPWCSPPVVGDPCTSQTPTSWEMLHGASRNLHLKRKGDLTEASPAKVCATEERMAARFREMHISPTMKSSSEEDVLSSPKSLVVLAPEIKKLVEPEKIFASALFNKVERPSMALVVWQPQHQVFGQKGDLSGEGEEAKPPDEEMAD